MLNQFRLFVAVSFFSLSLSGTSSNDSTEKTNQQVKRSTAWAAGWSYDDKFAAIGNGDGELSIYETKNWRKIKSWQFKSTTISRIEWNPKYPILAIAAFSQAEQPAIIQLYDVEKNEIISNLPDTMLGRCVSWSPSGDEVAFVGKKGKISLFSKSGTLLKTLSFSNQRSLFDLKWHPRKNLLLAVEEDIFLIDIDRDSLLATFDDGSKNKGILCCGWHPSGNFFVTGDYGHENEGGEPSYLKFWTTEGALLTCIKESKFEYRNVTWKKDGKHLAAAADVLLMVNEKGKIISKTRFDNNNLWGLAWNNKGDKILSGDQVGNIRVTDMNGTILKEFTQ